MLFLKRIILVQAILFTMPPVIDGKPTTNLAKMKKLAAGTISYAGYNDVKLDNVTLPAGKGAIMVDIW